MNECNDMTRQLRHDPGGIGKLGPNLKPGTVRVCGMRGLRKGMNTTQHLPSPGSRAWIDPPTNVQATLVT